MRYQPGLLVVSERNLRSLLMKLETNRAAGLEISACAIVDPDGKIMIKAEPDEVHYDPNRRAALGHAPYPGRVVRDAISQEPVDNP